MNTIPEAEVQLLLLLVQIIYLIVCESAFLFLLSYGFY